jgi:hypothetical protein
MINELLSVLDACEFARFAGGTASLPDDLYRRGIASITQMEEQA